MIDGLTTATDGRGRCGPSPRAPRQRSAGETQKRTDDRGGADEAVNLGVVRRAPLRRRAPLSPHRWGEFRALGGAWEVGGWDWAAASGELLGGLAATALEFEAGRFVSLAADGALSEVLVSAGDIDGRRGVVVDVAAALVEGRDGPVADLVAAIEIDKLLGGARLGQGFHVGFCHLDARQVLVAKDGGHGGLELVETGVIGGGLRRQLGVVPFFGAVAADRDNEEQAQGGQ